MAERALGIAARRVFGDKVVEITDYRSPRPDVICKDVLLEISVRYEPVCWKYLRNKRRWMDSLNVDRLVIIAPSFCETLSFAYKLRERPEDLDGVELVEFPRKRFPLFKQFKEYKHLFDEVGIKTRVIGFDEYTRGVEAILRRI